MVGAWKKKGLIFCPDRNAWWAQSHAQIPTVDASQDDVLQIFYSSRDENNQSRIGQLAVDAGDPSRVLRHGALPILELGVAGAFDDAGMMPSSLVTVEGVKYLYYIGWNVRSSVPYHNSVGLAVSEDNGQTYRRMFSGPIMDRTAKEPFFCATTCVKFEAGIWRNWYLSCTGWYDVGGRIEPRYHLKYAESPDGIDWRRDGTVAIDYQSDLEGGIVRASVLQEEGIYKMWFSYRGLSDYRENPAQTYKIGYAESRDGIDWDRQDSGPVVGVSDSGWDSEMVAYPEVVSKEGQRFLFYNGNGFGKTGFGYACWESQS